MEDDSLHSTVRRLDVLAETRLPGAIKKGLASFCDQHDLLAVVTAAWDVAVFRAVNSQLVFSIKRKTDECEITAIKWKHDGVFLGVAWSDHTYGIYSGENGKLWHHTLVPNQQVKDEDQQLSLDLRPDFDIGEDEDDSGQSRPCISEVGWSLHAISQTPPASHSSEQQSTEDWYDSIPVNDNEVEIGKERISKAMKSGPSISDLTRFITTLDVTRVMPTLSAMPAHGMPYSKAGPLGSKFSSQLATDMIFQPPGTAIYSHVDVSLLYQQDGVVRIMQDDTMRVGPCQIPGRPILQAASRLKPSHAVISLADQDTISLSLIHLPLATLGGPLLHVVSTNNRRIQHLIDYIRHTIRCIEHDFSTGTQLPKRLISSLEGMLEEKDAGSPSFNFYQAAMTGTYSPVLLEWLTDILKETNHKRWDQAVDSMYVHIQDHIFLHLLPALDRLSIAITTLRGHARYHEGTTIFDCPPRQLTSVLDKIDSLRLVAQKMQVIIMTERQEFRAFSKWLRVQVDIGVAEPFSNSALETEEREVPSIDVPLTLSYIRRTLAQSALAVHIQPHPGMQGTKRINDFFDDPIITSMTYENTKSVLLQYNTAPLAVAPTFKDIPDPEALLNLSAITANLGGQIHRVLKSITQWQSAMLSKPTSIDLDIPTSHTITDMIIPADLTTDTTTHLLSFDLSSPTSLNLHKITIPPSNSISTLTPPQPSQITLTHNLPSTTTVLDAKFTHSGSILLLTRQHIPSEHIPKDARLSYAIHLLAPTASHAVDSSGHGEDAGGEMLDEVVLHSFPHDSSFRPASLMVGGRTGKKLCVVFGRGGRAWKVLDLESGGSGM